MEISISYFTTPKAGNISQENEDAAAGPPAGDRLGSSFCFALADGATSAMLSRNWATQVVFQFAKNEGLLSGENLQARANLSQDYWQSIYLAETGDLINQVCLNWKKWLPNYYEERELRGKPVQWYEEPGLLAGAYSTLVQFRLAQLPVSGDIYFETLAIGDSCCFLLSDNIVHSFPLKNSSDFNNQPTLLSSNETANSDIFDHIKIDRGYCAPNSSFYLMTDALAKWFLKEYEAQKQPWLIIRDLDTRDQKISFNEWIDSLRSDNQLHNDDVALIRIDILRTT